MKSIRIHFAYRHVDHPWGGANNFIRALRYELESSGRFSFTEDLEAPCDLLFMNQLGCGPGGGRGRISVKLTERLQEGRRSWWEVLRGRAKRLPRFLVVRAVNLNNHAFPLGLRNRFCGRWADTSVIRLLNIADLAIFQSEYQRQVFLAAGYRGQRCIVIHNGADCVFNLKNRAIMPSNVLRFISSTASSRASKQHHLIARLSRQQSVEVIHFGSWPAHLDPANVRLMGTVQRDVLSNAMAECHYFFHPAIKDPCPNSIIEAICAGLPVIYHPGPGSSAEIVKQNGFALNENNLEKTIERARVDYAEFRNNVENNKVFYTIKRAAKEYAAAFKLTLNAK